MGRIGVDLPQRACLGNDLGRARTAALLLTSGEAPGDVVDKLGYYDEPHLARALRRYVGRTAQQLRAGTGGVIALDPGQRTTS
ncbi:hypothetical protein [Nocardia sp. NBC_01329]|uniref:hypothetical protein n=1 Tax=Nocardia sp. NBC_01329 TaxID=2903594 RepID=UPI002E141ED8|nr:hypothetical protein OG405_22725 [Nocardia sp. NBC_01329]